MGDPFEGEIFPPWVLKTTGVIILLAIVFAAVARFTGFGDQGVATAPVVEAREIRFTQTETNAIRVADAKTGQLIETIEPDSDQFLRGALRSLKRERAKFEEAAGQAYRVTRRTDGQVTLEDPATGQIIDLRAYGPTNVAAVARFLDTQAGNAP